MPPWEPRSPITFSIRRGTLPPTKTGVERPGCGRSLSRGTCRASPPHPAHRGPRRRPLPPPGGRSPGELWGRGGRGAQARTPARRALRAGLRTHCARGARGPWLPNAPLTLETRSPQVVLAPPSARELLASLSGPLDVPAASAHRPRYAGVRLCIWRAKSRERPPLSPRGFFSPEA